jgi:hypothetical protein
VTGREQRDHETGGARPWIRVDRDLAIALASLVVALSAVMVSVSQTRLMQRQAEASVWPRLALHVSTSTDSIYISVRNAGVGPAQLRWAQLLWRGVPLASVRDVIDSIPKSDTATLSGRNLGVGRLTGQVFTPAEDKVFFYIAGSITRPLVAAAKDVGVRLCYCSVYDQCWRLEARGLDGGSSGREISPVPACEPPAGPTI